MHKFLWGASTSGFQVEGGYNLGGKGLSTTDVRHVKEGIADTKVASDHYHHFKEDILLMKELGLKAYRFSFCWARIMPDGHHVNQEGLEFYDQIIQLCLENDIEPIPTLYHFVAFYCKLTAGANRNNFFFIKRIHITYSA